MGTLWDTMPHCVNENGIGGMVNPLLLLLYLTIAHRFVFTRRQVVTRPLRITFEEAVRLYSSGRAS